MPRKNKTLNCTPNGASARSAGCARKRGVEALLGRVADELAKHDGIGSSEEAAEAVRRLLCAECKGTGKTHRNYMWIAGGGREVECGRCYGTAIAHNSVLNEPRAAHNDPSSAT